MSEVLRLEGIGVNFGGVKALSGVDFQVKRGDISAVIGPNGAGKTTLLNVVSGFVSPSSGSIKFNGQDITLYEPHERGKAGVVRTFQNLEIFTNMTVLENVMTGGHRRFEYGILDCLFKTPRYSKEERHSKEFAISRLEFVGLSQMKDISAKELSFGNQRLLELARAIAAEPVVLLLDEPAAGLNMKETRMLGEMIRRIRDDWGITIVLVEHDMDLVMHISDNVMVLNSGCVIAKGTPKEVQKHPDVIAAYLGADEE